MRSLSDYLNIEDTVRAIKEFTEVPFFNEGNLFDLVVKKELEPIVYFDGYGSTWVNKDYSPYPEDFKDSDEWEDDSEFFMSEAIRYSAQSSHVRGYFYILYGESIFNSIAPIPHRRFAIQNLINYQIIPNYSLPNGGLNSKGDVFKKTPLYINDNILLSTESPKDGIIDPYFNRNDIKFSTYDIVKMLERNGYYSLNKQVEQPANNAKIAGLESQLAQVKAELAGKPSDNVTHSNTDIQNIKKLAIRQFNRSLAVALIDLDYQGNLRKGDIVNFIIPHMKELAYVLADGQADKAKVLTVKYKTIYDTHLQGLEFKQGTQTTKERERVNIDLLFKKQLPVTE